MLPADHSPVKCTKQDDMLVPDAERDMVDNADCSLEKIFDDSEPIVEPIIEEPSWVKLSLLLIYLEIDVTLSNRATLLGRKLIISHFSFNVESNGKNSQ